MFGPNGAPEAEELSTKEKLSWCLDNLGQRITTVGVGTSDARKVRGWAGEAVEVPEQHVAPIDVLYGAARRVADVYDPQTARAFLRSHNPYVDGSLLEHTVMAGVAPDEARQAIDGAVEAFLG